jgi:hypothetical protein
VLGSCFGGVEKVVVGLGVRIERVLDYMNEERVDIAEVPGGDATV